MEQNNLKENMNVNYSDVYNKIIITFPIYYNIFKKYYSNGTNITLSLNKIYKPIFSGLLEHYEKFMTTGIDNIITDIEKKFNPDKPYAIIDYLEYIFGNILYETFLFEIKKIDPKFIGYEQLCIFEYIINVETKKYKLYSQTINKIEPESKLLLAMNFRQTNCLKKIEFTLCYLKKNYPSYSNIIELCNNIIIECGIEFKFDLNNTDFIDSFMSLQKK